MEPVYQISRWSEVFENSESRKLKTLGWVSFPVDLDSTGYHSLIDTFKKDAPTIYGAWTALVCVAAKCHKRGVLASTNGQPMPLSLIASKARFSLGVMQRMWDWATSESVGWIEVANTPGDSPGNPPERREIPPDERHDTERQDRELPNHERPDERVFSVVRADVREEEMQRIVVDAGEYRAMLPTMERIARVVTRDNSITERRLRVDDRELCALGAVMMHRQFNDEWLSSILKSIRQRKTPPENPWGHFRGCLINAAKRKGVDFHEFEKRVSLPGFRKQTAEEVAS